ncbi:MAG TPA: multiheme c-type cytochrome, partial [Longimicrobiales bacterium]|nr:multiheme c-type cytochrome [Longimicrobiales bacterium]
MAHRRLSWRRAVLAIARELLMHTHSSAVVRALLLLAAVGTLVSCVDERVVYEERPIFDEPIAAAMDFLGYSDADEKLTTCGNCHVGMQAEWEETGHAHAWAGLQASDHAQESCEGCHTVNSLGNLVEGQAGGYLAVEDERYQDVQCESCHGPGLPHVRNPDAQQPLASIMVDIDGSNGCGECHSGAHHPFVDEWAESPHGNM